MAGARRLWDQFVDDFLDENMSGSHWRRDSVIFIFKIFKHANAHPAFIATIGVVALYRIGNYVPVPGVNSQALAVVDAAGALGTRTLLWDLFTGRNLFRVSVFALGILPYISASFYVQGAGFLWHLVRRRPDTPYQPWNIRVTALVAFLLCVVQASGMALFLEQQSNVPGGLSLVYRPGLAFRLMTVLTLTSGTALLVGLTDYVTQRGVANGMVLMFVSALIAGLLRGSTLDALRYRPILLLWLAVSVAFVVLISRGYRRTLEGRPIAVA